MSRRQNWKNGLQAMIETRIQLPRIKGLILPDSLTPEELTGVARDSALAVAVAIRKNFRTLADKSQSRYYWRGAIDSTEVDQQASNGVATIRISQVGVRLHWKGGTVRPTGRPSEVTGKPTRSLLIPFDDSPLRKTRQTLKEWSGTKQIRVIKSRRGCPILIATEEKKTRTNITWLGKLVRSTHHDPRPEVMPTSEELSAALHKGAKQHIKHLLARRAANQ